MHLNLKRIDTEVPLPRRAHPTDAGLDLCAAHPVRLEPGAYAAIRTGVAVAIPEGHAGLVLPRSGLARRHGVGLVNSPGLIDADYRGELAVVLINHGTERCDIARGDRIAQLVIVAVALPEPVVVSQLDETERGAQGFGSTGR